MKHAYLANLSIDKSDPGPLHRQLFLKLRDNILQNVIKAGTRLPSTRLLAEDLGVSRNTVLSAFDQLMAEGYLEARVGAGTYVSTQIPDELLGTNSSSEKPNPKARKIKLSRQAEALRPTGPAKPYHQGPFSPGRPELDQFPFEIWARLLAKHWRKPEPDYLSGNPVGGATALREALAEHLAQTRAVNCEPDQVIVLSGSQQAIHLVIKAFAETGDPILMEDPGFPGIRNSIIAAGANPIAVPVDDQGFNLEAAKSLAPKARLACLSPSHQYPLGPTMSLQRRLEILHWAGENDRFVLEDDYDSEYRYSGRPLSSLQGLDTEDRVLYVGSMSKVMFSGLRVGYLVVPKDLVDVFLALRRDIDGHSPAVAEAALAEFISEGHLATHIRKMRILYEKRQKVLISELRAKCGDFLSVDEQECGMHLIAFLRPEIEDKKVEALARDQGLMLRALSAFYEGPEKKNALIIGFAGTHEKQMPRLVGRLAQILETCAAHMQT
ncbi:PLP-dependent aminotransferase family protein [Sneathiella limimaris]|uniref:MocR-like pyridoxine biosynthesis transcription factor PdxR n=1 Tax=Sneathiella limimaris TaxID=1964213 RepID=UPI00146BB5C1|nr:PLP-dependent aminotransferase family protein [Sneathiella limimaris]